MSRSRVGFDEREYRREDVVRVRERDRESDRLPAFLRDERRSEPGPLVLRQREVETTERVRRRSPSPVRVRETRIVGRARSVSPFPQRRNDEEIQFRTVERSRAPSRGPDLERLRTRILSRDRSSSPSSISTSSDEDHRVRTRIVSRHRSPSRERVRIIEREKVRPRSPSPAPPPPVVKGPTVEREVITHLRTIDHGVVAVRPPSPPPPPRRKERDTEIDIYTSRHETEVDIHKRSRSRGRSRSHSRERMSPAHVHAWDDGVLVHADRKHLHVDIERRSHSRTRRAHSAAPIYHDYDDEAREITNKIDSRGRMGEAWNGITKDWTIVDVPPGTERVRMDGAGGASAEVTWQKYSGVRRAKFIPDRDEKSTVVSSSSASEREIRHEGGARESRLSVQIYDKGDRDIDIEKVTDRRLSIHHPPPAPRRSEMWTEITKDLVIREAIEEMGYEYEETEWFFYIMSYLRYEDVLQLVQLSDAVRRARKDRVREIQWEREYYDELGRERNHHHHHHHHRSRRHQDESTVEVSYEKRSSRYR